MPRSILLRVCLTPDYEGTCTYFNARRNRTFTIAAISKVAPVQPAQAYGSVVLYFLYPRAVSRITPRTCSSTNPSFLNSATAPRVEEESRVCLDKVTN